MPYTRRSARRSPNRSRVSDKHALRRPLRLVDLPQRPRSESTGRADQRLGGNARQGHRRDAEELWKDAREGRAAAAELTTLSACRRAAHAESRRSQSRSADGACTTKTSTSRRRTPLRATTTKGSCFFMNTKTAPGGEYWRTIHGSREAHHHSGFAQQAAAASAGGRYAGRATPQFLL